MTIEANLVKAEGSVNQAAHDRFEADLQAAKPEEFEWDDVKTFRRYARGRQRSTLSSHQQKMLAGMPIAHRHADNVSHKIIAAVADRVELLGFSVPNAAVDAHLKELFVKANLTDVQGDASYAVIRDGNHALGLLWHSPSQRVVVSRERWWDGSSGVFVAYDEYSQPAYAVKQWKQSGAWLRTIFYDDRIERYYLSDGRWQKRQLPGDAAWPVPWLKRDGTPLHMPIVHLPASSDDDTPYGASILDGGIIGLQDELNDVHRDVTMAARLTAFQMYWGTGVQPEVDEAGQPVKRIIGPGMFVENDNENAKYGVFPAGDMSQLIAAHRMKLDTISRNTSTPIHLITGGDWPSGEALLRIELPLIGQATRVVTAIGPKWATAAHRAVEQRNAFAVGAPLDEDALITANFAPVDRRDPLTLAQINTEKAKGLQILLGLGWSMAELQRMWGLTQEKIDEMAAERSVEQADAAASSVPPLLPPFGGQG